MKLVLGDLAVMGGTPAFSEPLHVGRPNIGDRTRLSQRLDGLLDRVWLTNYGPLVQEFEQKIADLTGAHHVIATCNATVALELASNALGMTGSVIVPSFTFIASAHALQRQGIAPVFCDVAPATHNIDPNKIEALIRPDTTGILATHLWGRACDVEALEDIARRRGLKLLFDAAHAFGCSHRNVPIGRFGDAEVFSFHATKAINSFEGGAVVTNDDELAARLRLMVNFGFTGYDTVDFLGTNGKMSEVHAAMGLTSLESAGDIFSHNRANYDRYRSRLCDIAGISMALFDESEASNRQYIVLEVNQEEFGLSRDELMSILVAEKVLARRYFYPGCHRSEPYRSLRRYQELKLTITEALCGSVLCLPTGTSVAVNDIDVVCSIIEIAARSSPAIARRLYP